MNTKTGQVLPWDEISEDEKKSGVWKELPIGYEKLSKSKQKQAEYNLKELAKQEEALRAILKDTKVE